MFLAVRRVSSNFHPKRWRWRFTALQIASTTTTANRCERQISIRFSIYEIMNFSIGKIKNVARQFDGINFSFHIYSYDDVDRQWVWDDLRTYLEWDDTHYAESRSRVNERMRNDSCVDLFNYLHLVPGCCFCCCLEFDFQRSAPSAISSWQEWLKLQRLHNRETKAFVGREAFRFQPFCLVVCSDMEMQLKSSSSVGTRSKYNWNWIRGDLVIQLITMDPIEIQKEFQLHQRAKGSKVM